MGLFAKIFGTDNDKQIKKLEVIANKVEDLSERYLNMTDKELYSCTNQFKKRLANGETLDDILPEAYACVRETSTRVLGMRHFHVQILGGICLHQGRIAEMCTGEGKTLVETLPAYLNALAGKGVHIVTVNDYLAKRDAEWMGQIFRFLGLSVGVITNNQDFNEKKRAYNADITYGTNSAFGFDFLRDNQVRQASLMVQRELNFVIIDEVDSVLIDEARTPLIISGKNKKSSEGFYNANSFAKMLKEPNPDADNEAEQMGDFEINEEDKKIVLTERGMAKAEAYFGVDNIGDYENMELYRNIRLAIKANFLMKKDKDYVVKDKQVIIVDEFTGRLQIGRRFNDGLHTAIEAKEGIRIKDENQVMATITYQNFFRMYKKISGMTGTAKTEEEEFKNIYGLDIVVIPTNKPIRRIDENDLVYKTRQGKLRAIVEDIKSCHEKGQPVLVGTVSVEKSEELSNLLYRERIMHKVLNAKNHESEAEIIAQAGRKGAVTIATNMAGRGTDIKLGGNPEFMAKQFLVNKKYSEKLIQEATSQSKDISGEGVKVREIYLAEKDRLEKETEIEKQEVLELGGLRVIGTERHESRRIDNQLRGRSGRQGDEGSSVFYISLEDDLVRIFAGDKLKTLAQPLPEDFPISLKVFSNKIEDAQKRIEARNFSIRKNVLAYDDVMNRQREIIYADRRKMLYDKTYYQETYEILNENVSSLLSTIDFYSKIDNIDEFNRFLIHELLLREDWHKYEYRKLLTSEDIQYFDKDKLIQRLAEKAIKYYKKQLSDYLDVLDKQAYSDAVDLVIDFDKPIENWDYKKLNSIIRNHLPTNMEFQDVFTLENARRLEQQNNLNDEGVVGCIKDNIAGVLSNYFSYYDEQIISSYVNITLEKAYSDRGLDEEYFTSLVNKELSSDHTKVITKQDIEPNFERVVEEVKKQYLAFLREDNETFTVSIVKELLSLYKTKLNTNPYEWDFKKVDKDLTSMLFVKMQNDKFPIEGLISIHRVNSITLKKLVKVATERIEKIYRDNYSEAQADEFLDKLKENYDSLDKHITALLQTRIDMEQKATEWDFHRLSEFLGFHFLRKSNEALSGTLLNRDDVKLVTADDIFEELETSIFNCYKKIFHTMGLFKKKSIIRKALSQASTNQSVKSYNDFLRNKLLWKDYFAPDTILIDEEQMKLELEERIQIVYDNMDRAIRQKVYQFNNNVLSALIGLMAATYSNDAIQKLVLLLSLKCENELKVFNTDNLRVSQTLAVISDELIKRNEDRIVDIDRLSKETATKLLAGEKVDGFDDEILSKAGLKVCKENAIDRVCTAFRSHRDSKSFLNTKSQDEIFALIESIVKSVFELQKGDYHDWNIAEINGILTGALLPSDTPFELVLTYFTKVEISNIIRDNVSEILSKKFAPIFEEIIEQNKKDGYKSAHEHILKMMPEVVAEVVADNVDYGIELSDWNYDEINANLRERIIPDIDEDVVLVDRQLASSMNIDSVIDGVLDKVIELYNKKSVSYNIGLIHEFIMDEVKDNVDRREPIENWDYKKLNQRFGSIFLAKVDREKEIFSEDGLRKYISDGKMTLEYSETVKAITDRLQEIYLERLDLYNRFIQVLCFRKAKPVRSFGDFERGNLLNYTDEHWFDHIDNMERLRVGIGLRALGQQNPITCYQSEGFQLFDEMIGLIHEDVVIHSLKDDPNSLFGKKEESISQRFSNKNKKAVYYKERGAKPTVRSSPKIGPNDPCPCGSGKKYKKCCMNKMGSVGGWNNIS